MKETIPEYLPVSPITIRCTLCNAKPNKACATSSGGLLEVVHVVRIKTAAKIDAVARKSRRKWANPMKGKEKERWMELCEQAANEQDSAKLLKLITEINRLLDEKSQRIEHKDSAKA
jgi:hypothetical protein